MSAGASVTIELPDAVLAEIAQRAAEIAAAQLAETETDTDSDGYLTAAGAAEYLGVSRKRIYDLASARILRPDGRDGRTPLYLRQTLDRYAQQGLDRP